MDDFGLTMDDLLLIEGIGRDECADTAVAARTLEKLESLGMLARGWQATLLPVAGDDGEGAWL